jgi:hypothetical protein
VDLCLTRDYCLLFHLLIEEQIDTHYYKKILDKAWPLVQLALLSMGIAEMHVQRHSLILASLCFFFEM